MKPVFRLQILLIVILTCSSFVTSQIETERSNTQEGNKSAFALVSGKPSVYIGFERTGKRRPPGDDVSNKAVWLKLHNNMRFAIKFCAHGLLDKSGNLLTNEQAGEIGLSYDIELTNHSIFKGSRTEIPYGNNATDFCHIFTLDAGKAVVFSVPAEHLVKGLSIKVPFNYEWESESENNPIHFVYFNSIGIPD